MRWMDGAARARLQGLLLSLTEGRRAAIACVVTALVVYGVESVAWPLHGGRDSTTYLMYWVDLWNGRPVFPELMLFRTPLAPLVFGSLLSAGGATLAEAFMGIAYAVSILAVGAAAYSLRRAWGVAVVVVLLASPDYGELFREVSSDSVFAGVFALWLYVVIAAARRPSVRRFAVVGASVAILVLARPSGQVLALVALLPLLLGGPVRTRLRHAAVCLLAAVAATAAWAGFNAARYDDFTVSRTDTAHVPLERAFLEERIVSPANGPHSRELAAAVRRELLRTQPYRAYGITLQQFFSSGSSRMYYDLIPLSDRVWGWSSGYRELRAVGLEAVRAHPWAYFRGVAHDTYFELRLKNPTPASRRSPPPPPAPAPVVTASGRRLPRPSEGDLIPRSHLWWLASTPDGRITAAPDGTLRFRDPRDARHAARFFASVDRLQAGLPPRNGSARAADLLNWVSRLYPSLLFWIGAGLLAFVLRRGRGLRVPAFLLVLALAVVIGTALSQPATVQYRLPLDPAFLLFAVAALLGASPDDRGRQRGDRVRPALRRVLGRHLA